MFQFYQKPPQGPRSSDDPDHGVGGSYYLPLPEAVGGSAAGQLCLGDGHHRPTQFWPFLVKFLLTKSTD